MQAEVAEPQLVITAVYGSNLVEDFLCRVCFYLSENEFNKCQYPKMNEVEREMKMANQNSQNRNNRIKMNL